MGCLPVPIASVDEFLKFTDSWYLLLDSLLKTQVYEAAICCFTTHYQS